jgi:glycogen(starch) synthase
VHVSGIHRQLTAAGVTCRVLDMSRVRPGFRFALTVMRHAFAGWTLHLHTNGHNVKSWLLALGCGLAGRFRGGCILTLHSGMVPGYLATAPSWRRRLAVLTCSLYRLVICVNPEIRSALLSCGLEAQRTEVLPAFLRAESPDVAPDSQIQAWIERHRPLFSTVLFFRPEYGFGLLVADLARLRCLYPSFGCLVMGSGEQRANAERCIREAGLEGNILLLGDVDHDACLALISACDVFLRPTLEDGDSISVREALSLGVPVVASRVGTRPAGAILFEPGNVEEMLAKIELALAARRGDQSQTAGCMDRLLEIYRQADGSEGSLCLN